MTSCVITGAGIAGLLAGRALAGAGWRVTLLDKGFRPGGRMATRRIGAAVFDHGAQFFTVRDPAFGSLVQGWTTSGLVDEWCRGFNADADGHGRYRAAAGMNSIPAALAEGLTILTGFRVDAIRPLNGRWAIHGSGQTLEANALILTPPVPQSLAIIDAGQVRIPSQLREKLESIQYERCLAALVELREPSELPAPGAIRPAQGPIAWLADNQIKGISSSPALTIHTTPEFSEEYWDTADAELARIILRTLPQFTEATPAGCTWHRWRYSQPALVHPQRALRIDDPAPLVFAGDAFGGPRVEGAALSGLAAARMVLEG